MKKRLPLVLSIASCIGVVATFVLTAKEAGKAEERLDDKREELDEDEDLTRFEIVKTVAPAYIPAITVGVLTIACIISSNVLSAKQQATLAAAYVAASNRYTSYRDKVKEIYGEEAHDRILDDLAADKAKDADIYPTLIGHDIDYKGKPRLFYDVFSDRYFESSIEAVMEAEYHLNRNYVMRGVCEVNEFYEFLGVDDIAKGDEIGWDCGGAHEGIYWLDFYHHLTEVAVTDDQIVPCVVIDMVFMPEPFDDDYMGDRTGRG